MKKTLLWIITIIIAISLVLASCSGGTPTPVSEASDIILSFFGTTGPEYLTMDDIKALPSTEAMAGIMSSTGEISIPELYKGVALKDLVTAFGGTFDSTMGVTLTAQDGYSMTYSYSQLMEGDFIAYDPALGNELVEHDPLTAILAYERNGEPLDPVQDGILRLVVVSEKNNQVTDGHWSIKWVTKVEVETIGETWTLDLEGAVLSQVDRGSYQSCASPGCHGVEWQDDKGQTWSGVPLYMLVGEVDDADSHSDYAYNEELADAGYTVDVIGSDGFTVSYDSVSIKLNGNIIVAYLVNESELPDKYYPLRLVGSDLTEDQMVGQVVKIVVHVPAVAATETSSEVAGDLIITGKVETPMGFSDDDLHASDEVITISAEHPKNGLQEFTGIRFYCLFNLVTLKPDASTVVLTASDGYTLEISLAEIQACENCMLSFTDTPGVYNAVMPGFPSGSWAKNVISIEVK
jgi:DMSO/TMAO reductase YedYZ molybdopterin-dependent catalytic subunit